MDQIELKQVTVADIEQLQKIGRTTFSETFSAYNTAENMNAYLEKDFAWEKLSAELGNPDSLFYFAVLDDKVIGYLKLNFGQSQTELKNSTGLEIERIYVLREYHGKKVGQVLFEKAMQVSREKNVDYVWLGVWEENPRAISFYKKNGFVEFDKHIFRLGGDEQTDIMMRLDLK